jgi:hypothetical protein
MVSVGFLRPKLIHEVCSMSPYIFPIEGIIVGLVGIIGFFIKRWMDNFEKTWREQMDNMERRYSVKMDKIETKLDLLMLGKADYITREEFLAATDRIHSRIDEAHASTLDLATRISVLEGKNSNHG